MESDYFLHDLSPQLFYDTFNDFIFYPEQKVFNKLTSKLFFAQEVRDIPGSIVELGVFKGSGMAAWLKICKALGVAKNIYGFDFFNFEELKQSIKTSDKNLMTDLFLKRNFNPKEYKEQLHEKLAGIDQSFYLIEGNIVETLPRFLDENPGFRVSLVNFDVDTSEPTLLALEALWPRLVPGGIFIFDEYGVNEWTESDAVDTFLGKHNLRIKRTNFMAPTAYIQKS